MEIPLSPAVSGQLHHQFPRGQVLRLFRHHVRRWHCCQHTRTHPQNTPQPGLGQPLWGRTKTISATPWKFFFNKYKLNILIELSIFYLRSSAFSLNRRHEADEGHSFPVAQDLGQVPQARLSVEGDESGLDHDHAVLGHLLEHGNQSWYSMQRGCA